MMRAVAFAVVLAGLTLVAWWQDSPQPHQSADGALAAPGQSLDQMFAGPTFDLTHGRAEAVFWLLGTLNEYTGRGTVEGRGSHIEQFFCDESALLPAFRTVLARVLREQGLPDDVVESTRQDCLVSLHSEGVAGRINRLYVDRRRTGGHVRLVRPEPSGEIVALYVSDGMFDGVSDTERIAYLAGAYARYGRGSSYVLSNAEHKAALIARLLLDVGATDIQHRTSRDTIPNGNVVSFAASAQLLRALEQQPR